MRGGLAVGGGSRTDYRILNRIYTQMEWLDPFDTVAFMAGVTEKVRLGLGVLIVPYRHPFDVARRVATIDILSGGRFVLGTGVGWLAEEFKLLGVPFERRGKRTREYIAVMKALWTQDKPRFSGEFVQLEEDVNVLPRPLQKPHPPIWVGGESVYALKRIVAFGDGWQIASMLDQLKRLTEEAGREYESLELRRRPSRASRRYRLADGTTSFSASFSISPRILLGSSAKPPTIT